MGLFRLRRSDARTDRFLRPKMLLFVLAAAAGLAGIATGVDALVGLAIALLVAALLLRALSLRE